MAGCSRKGDDETVVDSKERMRLERGRMDRGGSEGVRVTGKDGRMGMGGASESGATAY